jgi:F0F1-type ATP synthase assembly protein I
MAVFLPVTMIAVFAFTSVASWADARRREREAFYRSETLKKIAESSGGGADAALAVIREQDRIAHRQRLDGQRLGGIVCIAVAAGLMIFLWAVSARPAYLVGLIPGFVGVALLVHAATTSSKD